MSNHADVLTLTAATFQQEVLESDLPVLVDFWAAWCGPCRMVSPIVEAIAEEFAGRVKVAKLNIDDHAQIATRYSIQAIPTLLFFQDGHLVDQAVGVTAKPKLVTKINRLLQRAPQQTAS
ncbi:thioredoxin [Oculatella sp. LEGE 06141]|uniref:thioredoxin n=1 Tax=Oculatella sp. LEGE 06141 TaxID=1828648 RepID=UPI0018817701|nr:thioredoxin [Oculatella sp. LEGE 06141]MBE9180991.1 thioredoxin [Oculatella sp. LEGE 06141]